MKYLTISLLLAGGFVALSTMEASAVVCARGVYRAGCVAAGGAAVVARPVVRPAARVVVVAPRGSLFAAGCTDNPATHQLRNTPRYQRMIGSQGRTAPY